MTVRDLVRDLDAVANETTFSGVVRIERAGDVLYERVSGFADRADHEPIRMDTRFAIASGTKGFTAVTVMALVADEILRLDMPVAPIVDDDRVLIDPGVTVEHLLAHTSGIGDYLDESVEIDIETFELPVPVDQLADTEAYLAVLRGHPMVSEPGQRFAYCNSGYVLLALVAERAAGRTFYDLVRERVFEPARMRATTFPRNDALPAGTALGYLERDGGTHTNATLLPVRGSGDGGAHSTVDDVHAFWHALAGGALVAPQRVETILRARSDAPSEGLRYGLGFWIRPDRDTVLLEGCDAGVSFRSVFDADAGLVATVISNTTRGAWPLVRLIDEAVPELCARDDASS